MDEGLILWLSVPQWQEVQREAQRAETLYLTPKVAPSGQSL